jgi:hypothetical protein
MLPLGVATAALVAVLAGHPRDEAARLTRPQYEGKVQALYAGVESAFRATSGASGRQLAEKITLAQKALRHAADGLMAAKPPAEVEADNGALAEAMRAYARELDPARAAAASGDAPTMARFESAAASAAVRKMAEAAERMKYRGYRLGRIARD